jgi:hypothetical protein
MAEDLVESALSSKAKISYSGHEVDVEVIDGLAETRKIEDDNKAVIRQALEDRSTELGIKLEDIHPPTNVSV